MARLMASQTFPHIVWPSHASLQILFRARRQARHPMLPPKQLQMPEVRQRVRRLQTQLLTSSGSTAHSTLLIPRIHEPSHEPCHSLGLMVKRPAPYNSQFRTLGQTTRRRSSAATPVISLKSSHTKWDTAWDWGIRLSQAM